MNKASTGRLLITIAMLAFVGQVGVAGAADEFKKDKNLVKTADPVGQPGGGIQSTKASGADKVAKSRSCSGMTPKIKKVTPDQGTTGDKITISGENFGQPGCISGVSFGPGSPAKFTQRDDVMVSVTVPEGKRGLEMLTLTGFTGEDSKPFLRN
jgi:hypothetical protein